MLDNRHCYRIFFSLFLKTDNVCNDNDQNESRPALIRRQVVHYKQRFDWDCGISCVLMALSRQQRQQFLMNFNKICDSEGFGKW